MDVIYYVHIIMLHVFKHVEPVSECLKKKKNYISGSEFCMRAFSFADIFGGWCERTIKLNSEIIGLFYSSIRNK